MFFYFMLKALYILDIITFLCLLFVYVEKWFDKKAMVNSKLIMPRTGQQIILIHILANISRNKNNQTMKFGQLIEYNMRNIVLEKSYTKYVGQASPRPFHKKSKMSMSLDLEYTKGLFLLKSYVALDYNFEQIILSILNLHMCSFI